MGDATAAKRPEEQTESVSLPMGMTAWGQPVIDVRIGDGPPQRVILDTGASGSVLSAESASPELLHRSSESEGAVIGALGDTGESRRVVEVAFSADRWQSPVVEATLLSLDPGAMGFGVPVVGILGLDAVGTGLLLLDFVRQRVTLDVVDRDFGRDLRAQGFHDHPVRRDDSGLVLLDVLVAGTQVTGVLDSGAAATVLNTAAARQAGVLVEEPERGTRASASGVGQGSVEAMPCVPTELCIGECSLGDSIVFASELPVFDLVGLGDRPAMLLGPQALAECVVALDVPRSRLYISCEH